MNSRHPILWLTVLLMAAPVRADIYRWDTGEVISGTEGITAGPGISLSQHQLEYAQLSGVNLANAYLDGADLTWAKLNEANLDKANLALAMLANANVSGANLAGANLWESTLTGADLSGTNLANAWLQYATLNDADFSGAIVRGALFTETTSRGFTKEQLYSTASYQAKDLQGIRLGLNIPVWPRKFTDGPSRMVELPMMPWAFNDLGGWDLSGQNLANATLVGVTLSGANLSGANLAHAALWGATLADADFSGAVVTRTNLSDTTASGFTKEQLYSTASYQAKDLQGIELGANNLTGWDFREQNLANATFYPWGWGAGSILTGADFEGAVVTGANFFGATAFTKEQLYATASYRAKNLQGIGLVGSNLRGLDVNGQNMSSADLSHATLIGADLSGANFTNASFSSATLGGANFSGAIVTGVDFSGSGFTKEQLYSTASYQMKDLRGIALSWLRTLNGADFSGQNLANARFGELNLTGADFSGAVVTGANFYGSTSHGFTREQLYSTASYQAKNLSSIDFGGNDLSDWSFREQNLVNANLSESTLAGADLRGANLKNVGLHPWNTSFSLAIFDSSTVYNQWTGFPAGFNPETFGLTLILSAVGDLDANGVLDSVDIDWLTLAIHRWPVPNRWLPFAAFDLNDDGVVSLEDRTYWVKELKQTWYGDANLDGLFRSDDLVMVLAAGEYEDDIVGNSTWATGDWNADGEFTSADLVLALADGGYEQGPRTAVTAVPEPSVIWLLGVGGLWLATRMKRHR